MRILISGAGIAGLSAGIALATAGHPVTIVERAPFLRVTGSPIDVRGDAIAVAEKMGVLDAIRAQRVDLSERAQFVDSHGRVVAELPDQEISDSAQDIEIAREDLLHILYDAQPSATELIFDESISGLTGDEGGVDVRFTSGTKGRFDLVVGADGMHSAVRRLTFGPEREFLRHLGFYVAVANLPDYDGTSGPNPIYNFAGRMAGIASYHDKVLAVFIFRSPWLDYDYHDLSQQKELLARAYAGHNQWRVPELIDAARQDPELYFDSVSQITMPCWHQGRIVLVGDAAHCASNLSGRGTSLAFTGTALLAQALRDHGDDLDGAFAQYERLQGAYAARAQATAEPGGELLVPPTQQALAARNERLQRNRTIRDECSG